MLLKLDLCDVFDASLYLLVALRLVTRLTLKCDFCRLFDALHRSLSLLLWTVWPFVPSFPSNDGDDQNCSYVALNFICSHLASSCVCVLFLSTIDERLLYLPFSLQVVEARDRRSVVVTTPTSVKSFMLKLVELLHKLDISRVRREEDKEGDEIGAAGGIR